MHLNECNHTAASLPHTKGVYCCCLSVASKMKQMQLTCVSCVQLRNGPPQTMLQQQTIGIQFHEKPQDGASSSKDAEMSAPVPEDDFDTQYARRVQAKVATTQYNHAQRGCVFNSPPCSLLHSLSEHQPVHVPNVQLFQLCFTLLRCAGLRAEV